jgi:hypothetical protein
VKTTENKIVAVELSDSPIYSSTIVASTIVCEKNVDAVEMPGSPISSSRHVVLK